MLVSIITPFYQSEKYIKESIDSVINQTYTNWELILVNDGSTDNSKSIALSYQDKRIKYYEQTNKGVSSARNLGLKLMQGSFFCFLDSDDVLTQNSIAVRVEKFKENPDLSFVDGVVLLKDKNLNRLLGRWEPNFKGNPLVDLVHQTGNCFMGQTWMIKRKPNNPYYFEESLSHGEDLLFFMENSKNAELYDYVDHVTLFYRNTPNSAMTNLKGLEKSYRYIENRIRKWNYLKKIDVLIFGLKFRKSIFLSYLNNKQIFEAIKSILH